MTKHPCGAAKTLGGTGCVGRLPKMTLSEGAVDFIDDARLEALVGAGPADAVQVREIIAKSLEKQALTVEETAVLVRAEDPALQHELFEAARLLEQTVYGNRIVLFAPLYVGNDCVNDCLYCGFKRSNPDADRRTLDREELVRQVKALEQVGHKRLILVFGEHPCYDADFIADAARTVYDVKVGHRATSPAARASW